MDKRIYRPIFLIGCPRSGTTVIFETLSIHPKVAWFSHYLDKWPNRPWISILNRFTNLPFHKTEIKKGKRLFPFIPEPSEAWNLWRISCGNKFLYSSLTEVEPTLEEKKLVSIFIYNTLKYQGKKRFIAKLTGPPRIRYLKKIFPDAVFINIIRDGRAVLNSLMNVSFWKGQNGYTRPWWNDFPDDYYTKWLKTGKVPSALAALQWRHIIELTEREISDLSPKEYLTVKYEDFTANAHNVIKLILDFCHLDYHKYVSLQLKNLQVRSMNFKWKEKFSSVETEMLMGLIGDILKKYDYPPS